MRLAALVLVLAGLSVPVPVLAKDRAPTKVERAAIEQKLRSLGYTSWDEIELDDDRPHRQPKWEIDDARKGNGPRFDIVLEPGTLRIISEKPDD